MARQRSAGSRKAYERNRSIFSRVNRQLVGFILLLFIFALLCYTTFVMYNEGTLFQTPEQNASEANSHNNTGMTTVSIIYKNNNIS